MTMECLTHCRGFFLPRKTLECGFTYKTAQEMTITTLDQPLNQSSDAQPLHANNQLNTETSAKRPYREIPYNYTSFSDREIIHHLLGERAWDILEQLRESRNTGVSAHMLLEMLGDMWMVSRNPYVQDDLLQHDKRLQALLETFRSRIDTIAQRAKGNPLTLDLVESVHTAVRKFAAWFPTQKKLRAAALQRFRKITAKDNVLFDGLSRVSHVTDATDWRVALPFVVLTPDTEEEIAALVRACIELDLTIIPRGGGTGYTGGVIPLHENSAIINTEKLEALGEIIYRDDLPQVDKSVATVRCGAGVVTRRVSNLAQDNGLVFAVDPTSQDASTIGGNVAMNAGGKKAVLWGTALDNLVSWKMVTPEGKWLEVTRLNHNLGKIHDQATVAFEVVYRDTDDQTELKRETLNFEGQYFRKTGLGKDVTNKFLGGLPGIQKEGCDGLITSAVFILHRMPDQARTVCLEFYGTDLHEAVPAIVEVKNYLDGNEQVLLSGLEHLDDRYVKAVKYTPKSARGVLPKMVLIADVVGDDEQAVAQAASHIVVLANQRNGEGFIATTPQGRRNFWADRGRTAAIAAHTNAFKINEDVVIPLHNLAAYSEGIEKLNITQSMQNKLQIVERLLQFFHHKEHLACKVQGDEQSDEGASLLADKVASAVEHLQHTKQRWQAILQNFETAAQDCLHLLTPEEQGRIRANEKLIDLLLRLDVRITYRKTVQKTLHNIFVGRNLKPLRDELDRIHHKIRSSRLFIALHMHAGDGNIHSNIPVNSNDYDMMQAAEKLVDKIMILANELDGVISGEHGIGLTKIQYLDQANVDAFVNYKQAVDPQGYFNRDKLMPHSGLEKAYTPSLRLVEREALLLERDAIGELNDSIKNCLRCGKCKPVCTTHIPRANLLYSPRNKILATGLMIEAVLYEEQTHRGISIQHFEEMNDVADHCTVCHKCLTPCPVNIDFGEVSVKMRHLLLQRGKRKSSVVTQASMAFLNLKDPNTIKIMRTLMVSFGFRAQAFGHQLFKRLGLLQAKKQPALTVGKAPIKEQVIQFVKKPLPTNIPAKTTRAMLGLEEPNIIPILRQPNREAGLPQSHQLNNDSVFYFPGCGSERLFSQVGLATLAMLYEVGATTVLPPGYLCCGYPQNSSGETEKGSKISTENQVLFHRVAKAVSYLNIQTVIVSCGTCMDQLLQYQFERIFPNCRLLDIHEYLHEKGIKMDDANGVQYLYHEPCHTPMKHYNSLNIASELTNSKVTLSDRCCGEAGTFAVSRPDIASQLRYRKENELKQGIQALTGEDKAQQGNVKLLTSCPACQQGLSRYADSTGLDTDYIVVEVANNRLGEGWQQRFVEKATHGGIEQVLL